MDFSLSPFRNSYHHLFCTSFSSVLSWKKRWDFFLKFSHNFPKGWSSVILHWQMQREYKTYQNLAVRRKTLCIRCILIVCHTLYPSSIRTLWFHPRKKFGTAPNLLNGWTLRHLRCQSSTYTNNKRSMSVLFVNHLWYPFWFLLASSKPTTAALENGERKER